MKRSIAAGLLLLLAHGAAMAGEPAAVKVSKVLTTTTTVTGQKLVLPGQNAQLLVTTLEIAPGARLPRHMHPYPRYAYVLEGNLTVDYEGTGPQHYRKGDFIVEAVNTWHFGMNSGTIPLRLLVIDQVEAGKSNMIMAK
jgi:quercetin dioxygenase-like cupin family protein